MKTPLTFFAEPSNVDGFLLWEDYLTCRPWTVRLGGRWWRPFRPFRSLWSRTVRVGWRCRRLWEEWTARGKAVDPSSMNLPLPPNEHARPRLGREYVFPLEFVIFPKTMKRAAEGYPEIAPLKDRPGLYRLRGRVLSAPKREGEGWLLDCGLRGFSLAKLPPELAVGAAFEAEGWLLAQDSWVISEVPERLQRHVHTLPYCRWRVEEEGWEGGTPGSPDMFAAQRIAMGYGRIPGIRLRCSCIEEVPPSHVHWLKSL